MPRKMRGALYFRPLALALAFLIMPKMPVLRFVSGVPEAAAQSGGCEGSRILRTCDADWVQFEKEVVESYLLAHRMTSADEALLYQYGSQDLRNDIRALLLARMISIIRSESRTALEQRLYNQLRNQIWALEIDLYDRAVRAFQTWQSDPCNWRPNPDIAAANNLYYDGSGFCAGGTLANLFVAPKAPTRSYFMSAALTATYHSAFDNKAAAMSLAETMSRLPLVAGIAGAAGALLAGTWLAVTAVYGTAIATAMFVTGVQGVGAATASTLVSMGTTVLAAGPAAIIAFAVLIGVTAAFNAYQIDENVREIQALEADRAAVGANPPNLRAFLDDGPGYMKLSSAFVSRTLPDVAGTQPAPEHADGDPVAVINGVSSPSFAYRDWEGSVWGVTTVGNWLKHTRLDMSEVRFSPSFKARSGSGEKLYVSRSGGSWMIVRPDSSGGDCPASPATGITPENVNLANCRSYVSNTVALRNASDQSVVISLSQKPSFATTQNFDLTFTQGVARTVTFQAAGIPLPAITGTPVQFPGAGLTFEGSSVAGPGAARLNYTNAPVGEYFLNLTAANAAGSTTQTVRIRVLTGVSITSPGTVTMNAYEPFTFTVTASGTNVAIATNVNWASFGLTFTDNGNGTATLSGVPKPFQNGALNIPNCPSSGSTCFFTASNDVSTVQQPITLDIRHASPPNLHAASVTFVAGVPNAFRIFTSGWNAPPTVFDACQPYHPIPGSPFGPPTFPWYRAWPSWLTLTDNGDGTADLSGIPPFAETDYSVEIKPQAHYDHSLTSCENAGVFAISVSMSPQFLSESFGVFPRTGAVLISTTAPSGTLVSQGLLPEGITFQDLGNGTARFLGTPTGRGGHYPVTLTVTHGPKSTSQNFNLYVLETAKYEGPAEVMFHTGVANSFTLMGTGFPKAPIPDPISPSAARHGMSFSGAGINFVLPSGITLVNKTYGQFTGNAVLSGTPADNVIGRHDLALGVWNGYESGSAFTFKLHIVKAGDVNGDGVVNCADYNLVENALGGFRGAEGYDFRADTNNDGFVDDTDKQFVHARMAGLSCLGTPPQFTLNANPSTVRASQQFTLSGNITAGANPVTGDGHTIRCDFTPIGGASNEGVSTINMTWSFSATVAAGTAAGPKTITCRVNDSLQRTTTQTVDITVSDGCGEPKTLISAIQGIGPASGLVGNTVEVEGIVTGAFQGLQRMNGFFIQDEGDGNPATSDGLFVDESAGSKGTVQAGQKVRLKGVVAEKENMTVLGNISVQMACGGGPAPAPVDVTFPLASTAALESYEGMLVRFPQQLRVTDTSNLGRFNEVGLAFPPQAIAGQTLTRLYAPTQVRRPGAEANALRALNDRSRIILDDGSNAAYQSLDPAHTYPAGLSAANTLRLGARINITEKGGYTPLVGVISQGGDGQYRIQPVAPVSFQLDDNPRPSSPPAVAGRVRVASLPALNYFSTPNAGGAHDMAELERQREKIVNGLVAMDPAVVAVTGIENNNDALFGLLAALNAKTTPAGKFQYVTTGLMSGSAVANGFLYQPALVQAVGNAAVLDSATDPAALTQRNVPSVAQTFRLLAGSAPQAQHFTVVATHLKDRLTPCEANSGPADQDQQDGQGHCNLTRVSMARALLDWLHKNPAKDPTPDGDRRFLIVGDFNAYAMEDPVRAMTERNFTLGTSPVFPGGLKSSPRATYVHLAAALLGLADYSNAAGGHSGAPDHALANQQLFRAVNEVARWRINADEPVALDYNLDFSSNGVPAEPRSAAQQSAWYSAAPVRMSAHDPIIVGFNPLCGDFNDDGEVDATDQAVLQAAFNKTPVDRRLDLDGDGRVSGTDLAAFRQCQNQARK